MRKVEISKAEAALWGSVSCHATTHYHLHTLNLGRIEHLAKFKKKQAKLIQNGKESVAEVAKNVVQTVNALRDGDESCSWKREILEGKKIPEGRDAGDAMSKDNSTCHDQSC